MMIAMEGEGIMMMAEEEGKGRAMIPQQRDHASSCSLAANQWTAPQKQKAQDPVPYLEVPALWTQHQGKRRLKSN